MKYSFWNSSATTPSVRGRRKLQELHSSRKQLHHHHLPALHHLHPPCVENSGRVPPLVETLLLLHHLPALLHHLILHLKGSRKEPFTMFHCRYPRNRYPGDPNSGEERTPLWTRPANNLSTSYTPTSPPTSQRAQEQRPVEPITGGEEIPPEPSQQTPSSPQPPPTHPTSH